jgi:4-alpha-glucanotransferase
MQVACAQVCGVIMKNICPTSLFPQGYRASGVALDVAALPSPYGIGDMGPSSVSWVDRLQEAGQSWWHALHRGSSRSCDSVYQPLSSFSGNALLISPDWLIEDGLLSARDCDRVVFPAGSIDYDVVVPFKHWLLEKAWKNFNAGTHKDLASSFEKFRKAQGHWLEDYALFCALKAKYRGAPYHEWPAELARRSPAAIADARRELTNQMDQVRFSQFLLSRQTQRLKNYAHAKGVRLIGDLTYLIAADSSEAWACPELFFSDEQPMPDLVPLCFSSSDRLGHDDDRVAHSRASYRWFVDRLRFLLAHVDVASVDVHALAAPLHSVDGAPAKLGCEEECNDYVTAVSVLIDDGVALDDIDGFAIRDLFRIPETRVLQLAFDGRPDNPHLPQNYTPNSVAYTSLHNGAGTREWLNDLPADQREAVSRYFKRPLGESKEVAWELLRAAWSSAAALAMVPLHDLLDGGTDRTSRNGTRNNHRQWRWSESMLSASAFYWLRELTRTSNRTAQLKVSPKVASLPGARRFTRMEAAL